jgi:alpha-tubulin suppressor-like RCC1 family protein
VFVWGSNEFGQLGTDGPESMSPRRNGLRNIKKISAAANFSVAVSYEGEAFVWGMNHYGQLGTEEKVVWQPKKVASGCLDVEAGEGAVVLVMEDRAKVAGFGVYREFVDVQVNSRVVEVAVGDTYVAVVDGFGEVYSIGGLFSEEKRKFFIMKEPELKFKKAENGFLPGKVKTLKGKYSYHAAIIDA